MRTDELISVLAAGAAPVSPGAARRRLLLACLIGLAGSGLLVFGLLPPRELLHATATGPFWMKVGYGVWLGIGGYLLVEHAARPGAKPGVGRYVVAAGLVSIAVLAAADLAVMPASQWRGAWMGHSAMFCPVAILITAIPVFIAVSVAMRGLAPTHLRLAGAAAGLLAGGLGAAMYALWCREPTAMFVASWYTLGVGVCAGIGALLGPKILRW